MICRVAALALALATSAGSADARIHRSHAARDAFCASTGYPHCKRPGYVVDHVIPLACGGPDQPSNMQWQTIAEGKAKDKWERKGCTTSRRRRNG